MGALTTEFLFDLESNMRVLSAREFHRLAAPENLWWRKVTKEMPSRSKKERISWLLDSARIEYTEEGSVDFSDLVSDTYEIEIDYAAQGLRMLKSKLEDLDGNGVQVATEWSRQIGALAAYWPQKQVAAAIRNGGSLTGYDGEAFFSTAHPVNPFDTSAGTYANDFTGGAAKPIDVSVSVEEAVANVQAAIAAIANIPMPNGEDPRLLKPVAMIVPPALTMRATLVTSAKFIAMDSASAGGSGDVSGVVANFGLGTPIVAPELGAAFGGSDTTWYLACAEITSDELGAFIYVNREPFAVTYHDGMTDAELARARQLEWLVQGRNVVGLGHPYHIFRCRKT